MRIVRWMQRWLWRSDPQTFPPWKVWEVVRIMPLCLGAVYALRRLLEFLYFTNIDMRRFGNSCARLELALVVGILAQIFMGELLLLHWSAGLVRRQYGVDWSQIGWRSDFPRRWALWAGLTGTCLGVVTFLTLFWYLGNPPPGWRYVGAAGPPVKWWPAAHITYSAILPPLAEEIYFRGIMYPMFRKRVGRAGGIVLSTLLFVCWHPQVIATPAEIPSIAVGGVLSCLFLDRTRSLVPSMVMHATINVSAMLSAYLLT